MHVRQGKMIEVTVICVFLFVGNPLSLLSPLYYCLSMMSWCDMPVMQTGIHLTVYLSVFLSGVAASSFLTSGKYAIDPELRGQEYERITQNLDVHFWKTFWNVTETEVLSVSINHLCVSVRTSQLIERK